MGKWSDTYEPFLVPPFVTSTFIPHVGGPSYRIVWFEDGGAGFEHRCDRGDRGVVVCAPRLSEAHSIASRDPLTINPSIVCPDCGTHGWVRNGRWIGAN